jgi:hypothetical protein
MSIASQNALQFKHVGSLWQGHPILQAIWQALLDRSSIIGEGDVADYAMAFLLESNSSVTIAIDESTTVDFKGKASYYFQGKLPINLSVRVVNVSANATWRQTLDSTVDNYVATVKGNWSANGANNRSDMIAAQKVPQKAGYHLFERFSEAMTWGLKAKEVAKTYPHHQGEERSAFSKSNPPTFVAHFEYKGYWVMLSVGPDKV